MASIPDRVAPCVVLDDVRIVESREGVVVQVDSGPFFPTVFADSLRYLVEGGDVRRRVREESQCRAAMPIGEEAIRVVYAAEVRRFSW